MFISKSKNGKNILFKTKNNVSYLPNIYFFTLQFHEIANKINNINELICQFKYLQ